MSKYSNSRGFSLIELLIAIGILGIVAMGLSSVITQTMKSVNLMNQKVNAMDLKSEAEFHFSEPSDCTAEFGPHTVDFAQVGGNATVQALSQSQLPYISNLKRSGLEINSAAIQFTESASSTLFYAYVVLSVKPESADSNNPIKVLKLPIIAQRANATDTNISNCVSTKNEKEVAQLLGVGGSGSPVIYGSCQSGYIMVGLSKEGIICEPANEQAAIDPNAFTADNPGKGCNGVGCTTEDYGPCYGTNCRTNGNFCEGTGCIATGATASCTGTSCCAGASCDPPDEEPITFSFF